MPRSNLANRALYGALAGIVGTAAMTLGMRLLHRSLPEHERYPLPPREIIERIRPDGPDRPALTQLAHYAYGALTGALYGMARRSPSPAEGAAYGVLVWTVSYLGWIPGARILNPATRHPVRRNALMLAVHLIWGGFTALALRDLHRAEREVFFDEKAPARDAPRD